MHAEDEDERTILKKKDAADDAADDAEVDAEVDEEDDAEDDKDEENGAEGDNDKRATARLKRIAATTQAGIRSTGEVDKATRDGR